MPLLVIVIWAPGTGVALETAVLAGNVASGAAVFPFGDTGGVGRYCAYGMYAGWRTKLSELPVNYRMLTENSSEKDNVGVK